MARTFEIGGLKYDLLDIDDFDFDQGKEFDDLAGHIGIFAAQEGYNRGDMNIWRALLLMSIQVKNPTFTMDDLGRQKILPLILSMNKASEVATVPPGVAPVRSRRRNAASPNSSDGAETPDAPGVPA